MAERRSLTLALLALLAGGVLVAAGAGSAWVTVQATLELPGVGRGRLGEAALTGNDLFPFGALGLLALLSVVAVAATRGRGRWAVGCALLCLGLAVAARVPLEAAGAGEVARRQAAQGRLDAVAAGTVTQVAVRPAGPALTGLGGLLVAAAGAEALRRGRAWPALGDTFRAPGDRARQPLPAGGEPPWEEYQG